MATPYPYLPRPPLRANVVRVAADRAVDCDSGVYLLSALPLVLLLAEGLAGVWLWYSVQSMWCWPLIVVLTLVASLALSAAAVINLVGAGVALLALAAREGNVITRIVAGLGLLANLAAQVPIAWIVVHWLLH
jgi:hypothetical protein